MAGRPRKITADEVGAVAFYLAINMSGRSITQKTGLSKYMIQRIKKQPDFDTLLNMMRERIEAVKGESE